MSPVVSTLLLCCFTGTRVSGEVVRSRPHTQRVAARDTAPQHGAPQAAELQEAPRGCPCELYGGGMAAGGAVCGTAAVTQQPWVGGAGEVAGPGGLGGWLVSDQLVVD